MEVGSAWSYSTTTVPDMAAPWIVHVYANEPAVENVRMKLAPLL